MSRRNTRGLSPGTTQRDGVQGVRIERTRNRNSRAVLKNDVVVIRLARRLTSREEQEHIEALLRRMAPIVARERRKTRIEPFRALLRGETDTLSLPLPHETFTVHLSFGTRTTGTYSSHGWNVTISPRTGRRTLHRLLWKLLEKQTLSFFTQFVHQINDRTFRTHVRSVKLRYAVSQWGSCSRDGRISLNPALLFVEPPLLQYVIIHELAHRLHPNHSAAYWRTVERFCADYAGRRKKLNGFRLPPL